MAGRGVDFGQDVSFVPGADCLTNTSLHRIVCGGSGTSAFTPNIPNTTTMTLRPVGIIQTPNLSATSAHMSVRTMGVSAVLAGSSVDAFTFCKVGSAASMTGYAVMCSEAVVNATLATNTLAGMTLAAGAIGIIGQAMEQASTLQKFEILVRPWVSGLQLY